MAIHFNVSDELTTYKDIARELFFRTIKRRKQQILTSLRDYTLPVYREACTPKSYGAHSWFDISLLDKDLYEEAFYKLRVSLITWSSYYSLAWIMPERKLGKLVLKQGLANEWCLDVAIQTLLYWCFVEVPDELDWIYSVRITDVASRKVAKDIWRNKSKGNQVILKPALGFKFEFLDWDIVEDTWSSYREKIKKEFNTELERYYKIMKEVHAFPGRRIAVNKRNPSHFDWLFDYQIEEMKFSDIATKYGGSSQALSARSVSEAIHSLADLLMFTIRPPQRGRPRKR